MKKSASSTNLSPIKSSLPIKSSSSTQKITVDKGNDIALPTLISQIEELLQISDLVFVIEHCCNCKAHNGLSLRHDPEKYQQNAIFFLRKLCMLVHSYSLNIRLGAICIPFSSAGRIGAFEIYLLYRNQNGSILRTILHSKLSTTQWPSVSLLERKLKEFLVDSSVPLYADRSGLYADVEKNEGKSSYPVGFGSWDETPLADEEWNYQLDSNELTNNRIPNNPKKYLIQWVYDSREHTTSDIIFSVSKLFPLPDNNPSVELLRATCSNIYATQPPDSLAVEEIIAFHISYDQLTTAGGSLLTFAKNRQSSQLSYSLGSQTSPDYLFNVEAVLQPGKSKSYLIKMVIRLKVKEGSTIYKAAIYGPKEVKIGGPDGILLGTYNINIGPALSIRAAKSYHMYDKHYNRLMTNSLIEAELRYCSNTDIGVDVIENNKDHSYSLSTENGIIKIPPLFEGVWTITFNSEGFLPYSHTFLQYQDNPNDALAVRKAFLQHHALLPYMVKPKAPASMLSHGSIRLLPASENIYVDILMIISRTETLPETLPDVSAVVDCDIDDKKDEDDINKDPPDERTIPSSNRIYCGSFRADKAISLLPFISLATASTFEKSEGSSLNQPVATFECIAYILPHLQSHEVDDDDLKNGYYSSFEENPQYGTANALYSTETVLKLKEFTLTATLSSSSLVQLHPPVLDTLASKILVRFMHQDLPVSRRTVEASFVIQKEKDISPKTASPFYNLDNCFYKNCKTDDYGCCSFIVPGVPGKLQLNLTTESGRNVSYERYIPPRKECKYRLIAEKANVANLLSLGTAISIDNEDEDRVLSIAIECKIFARIPAEQLSSRPLVLLADISGSMGPKNDFRMKSLKGTLLSMFNAAVEVNVPIALVAWCSWNYYCSPDSPHFQSEGATLASKQMLRYLNSSDAAAVASWVEKLQANGGNNLRFAIEDAMNTFPDAKDVIIFCDGDVRPFTTKGGSVVPMDSFIPRPDDRSQEAIPLTCSWVSFCKRYPAVKLHFVSIGLQAQHDEMNKMSAIGGGSFTSVIE